MLIEESFTRVLREWAEVFMHRSMRDFKRFMDDSGLSASQVNALMRLYHSGACSVSDISNHLGITNAAASQMIDRLVNQGLLQRSEDQRDRRNKVITLASRGKELIEQGIEARRLWMESLTSAFTPAEQQQIIHALTLLTQAARRLETQKAEKSPFEMNSAHIPIRSREKP